MIAGVLFYPSRTAFWNERLIPYAIPNGVLSVLDYIIDVQRIGTPPSYIRSGRISDAGGHVVKSGQGPVLVEITVQECPASITIREMSLRRAVITLSACRLERLNRFNVSPKNK